jgi:hypothetical protein
MEEKIKRELTYYKIGVVILILLLLIMFVSEQVRNGLLLNKIEKISSLNKQVAEYVDENQQLIQFSNAVSVERDLLLANKADLREQLQRLKLKKPDAVINYISTFKTDSILVKFNEKLPCDPFNKSFKVDSPYYNFSVVITDSTFYHSPLTVYDTASFIIAEKKDKWYKSSEYSVVFDNRNKAIKLNQLEGYTLKPKRKFYNTVPFKGALVVGGIIIGFVLSR